MLKCNILDLTSEPFKPLNATKLDALRESGSLFSIEKTYVRGDGTLQPVRSCVSLLTDAHRGSLLAATVVAVPDAHDFVAAVQMAQALLIEQKSRLEWGDSFDDANWRLLLAAYLAEAEGAPGRAHDLSALAGGSAQENLLGIWNLVQRGALVVDGDPSSLESASVQLSSGYTEVLERHFQAMRLASVGPVISGAVGSSNATAGIDELRLRAAYLAGATAACEGVYAHLLAWVTHSINQWLLRDLPAWRGGPPPIPYHEPPT